MSSWQSHLLRPFLWGQKQAQRHATIESTRRMSVWSERLYSVPKDVRHEKFARGVFTYEWLIPKHVVSDAVIFHIHGGGFVFPLYNPVRYTSAYLARLAGMRALLPEYRLAPEHPFPAALEDCVAAYRWLISEGGVSPQRVVFSGESAGGNLVVTTLLSLRDAGDPLPIGAASICPVFDFEGRGSFYSQNDPMAQADFTMLHLKAYQGSADPHNPLLSPLYADLHGLPPLLIQTGEQELLRSGAEALSARAQRAGVPTTLEIWPGMWHFWHVFVPFLPEAQQAMETIRAFMSSCARVAGS
jgi:monoterpene epsilon-lactone hydrolase